MERMAEEKRQAHVALLALMLAHEDMFLRELALQIHDYLADRAAGDNEAVKADAQDVGNF